MALRRVNCEGVLRRNPKEREKKEAGFWCKQEAGIAGAASLSSSSGAVTWSSLGCFFFNSNI